jgi:PAS domain S-box-containing protein
MSQEANLRLELEERLRFETLIADLSSEFVNLPGGEVDGKITDAQRGLCELLSLDFSALWQWSDEAPGCFILTHFWSAQATPTGSARMTQEQYPWAREQMLAGRVIKVSSLEELPKEAARDRETLRQFGIKSNLALPLLVGGQAPLGILGLGTMRAERDWPEVLVKRLQLVAQIFANALERKRTDQVLGASEELNRATFDQAAVGIAHVGTDGRWLRVNDKLCAIVGYPREELLQLTFQDITHPDDLEIDLDYVHQILSGQIKTYSMEKRYFRKDRSLVWANLTVSLVRTAAGEPHHFISVLEDITTRKRAEEALRASEVRLAAGTDLAGLGYYEVDYAGRTCFLDDRFRDICGLPAGVQEGLQPVEFWLEHVHPDDRQYVLEQRQKLHYGNMGQLSVEYRYLHPSQGQKWLLHMACMAAPSTQGNGARTYGVLRDITETRLLSEKLRSSAAEWQSTFDSINDLVIILDPEYRIVRVNEATVKFLGLPMERIVGNMCCNLIHGSSCPIKECPCQKTFQTHMRAEAELFHPGSGRWLAVSTDPIMNPAGELTGAVHVGRDVTEAKRVEDELARQRAELAHVTRMSTMGQLASSLAHELNQPLGAILRNAEAAELFLQDPSPDLEEVRAILADIRSDDQRAGEVIDRVRSFIKGRVVERGLLSLSQLAGEVLALVRPDAEMRRIRLAWQSGPPLPSVCGDRVQLQQVLLNLILNAMDAASENPPDSRLVTLQVSSAGATVHLSVSDNGHGIAAERLPLLFEPFSTSKPNGLGMGLAISRSIIEAHGGRLWGTNQPAGGATFTFSLAAAEGEGGVIGGQ